MMAGTIVLLGQLLFPIPVRAEEPDTLAPRAKELVGTFESMWSGFDPEREPLESKTLHEWQEGQVQLSVVQFRIGIFKGVSATLVGILGVPEHAEPNSVPGLVQIHGGGQYADYRACKTNAARGYATLSIAWAGRINSPGYHVSPKEVSLFWDQATNDPRYRITTDWGVLDGYHAPGRNAGNQFPSIQPAAWTLDSVESPRNSGWFLCAMAARRALTFLEHHPQVDPSRLGVYGHSMGGKLTILTATDARVRAAVPSCGGISDRVNASALFRATLSDDVSLKRVQCPTLFLSPANDFHGRLGDLPAAVNELGSNEWRVVCSPHHNHQDTPEYEVATSLWFDQHLQGSFRFPQTPQTDLSLDEPDGVPVLDIRVDRSMPILSVDVYYTQQGREVESPQDREHTMHRFWHHAQPVEQGQLWRARLPLHSAQQPLWAYANVRYALPDALHAAGYYYREFDSQTFVLSSLLTKVRKEQFIASQIKPALMRSELIEDFAPGWEKEWFSYQSDSWARSTHKLYDPCWQAPKFAQMQLGVFTEQPNKLVVVLDSYATEVPLKAGEWNQISLDPSDFVNVEGVQLDSWNNVRRLKLTPQETLRPKRGTKIRPRVLGANWSGATPQFRRLLWKLDSAS